MLCCIGGASVSVSLASASEGCNRWFMKNASNCSRKKKECFYQIRYLVVLHKDAWSWRTSNYLQLHRGMEEQLVVVAMRKAHATVHTALGYNCICSKWPYWPGWNVDRRQALLLDLEWHSACFHQIKVVSDILAVCRQETHCAESSELNGHFQLYQ